MTVKPDVMGEVPEEEGYYFRRNDSTYGWRMTKVEKENWHGIDRLFFSIREWDLIKDDKFDNYTWSEKIGEPDE